MLHYEKVQMVPLE